MIYDKNYEEKQGGRIKMCLTNLRKGKKMQIGNRGEERRGREGKEKQREKTGGGEYKLDINY
jgi:hypothetical protein